MNHDPEPLQWTRRKLRAHAAATQALLTGGTRLATGARIVYKGYHAVQLLALRSQREQAKVETVLDSLHKDAVFWDVGACLGTYSIPVSQRTHAWVHAFEPHPDHYEALAQSASLHGFQALPYALSNETQTWDMVETNPGNGGVRLLPTGQGDVQVTSIPGNEAPAPDPTHLKIDVQGHAIPVLEGLDNRLTHVEDIFIEPHDNAADIRDHLEDHTHLEHVQTWTTDGTPRMLRFQTKEDRP